MRFAIASPILVFILGSMAEPASAQATGASRATRITIVAGPSESVSSGLPARVNDGAEPLVGPAGDGFHVAAGLMRAIQGSALELRAEALYNRVTGAPATYLVIDYEPGQARMALRSDSYALLAGLTWRAFPDRSWTPYLITSGGLYHSRLGTNPDDQDETVTETYAASGPGVNAGAGILLRLGTREGFFEVRRHVLFQSQGGSFVPLSFGLRF